MNSISHVTKVASTHNNVMQAIKQASVILMIFVPLFAFTVTFLVTSVLSSTQLLIVARRVISTSRSLKRAEGMEAGTSRRSQISLFILRAHSVAS